MSTFVPAVITCPSCGGEREVQLATSLNVSRTPDHKANVLRPDFQCFACPDCGTETVHILDFAYLDFDTKLFFGVLRDELIDEWETTEWEIQDAFQENLGEQAPTPAQPIGVGFRIRTVFGLDALREKVVAADEDVDDVALELVKLRVLVNDDQERSGLPRLVGAGESTLTLRWPDGETVELPRLMLDDALDPTLSELAAALTAGPWVDAGRLLRATA